MGMQSTAKSGRRRRRAGQAVSDINVTPMVDVMLVLLVIFMVTAPMLSVSIPVDLPQTQGSSVPSDKEPLVITLTARGEIYLQETKIAPEMLVQRLKATRGANPEMRIFLRGDRKLSYGNIMEVMGQLNAAGFKHVALVADIPKEK